MDVIVLLLVVLVLAVVVLVVSAPLRGGTHVTAEREEARRADLEQAKRVKYREIRDAEMDYRTGKLSEADWRAIDRELRAEAMGILRDLDRLGEDEQQA